MVDNVEAFPKAVVVLAGGRDYYQLPFALNEENLLRALVTDMYWPADKTWFTRTAGAIIPESVVTARFCSGVSSEQVRLSRGALCLAASMKIAPHLKLNRAKDRALGRNARWLALQTDAALFSYNYYASEAFKEEGASIKHRFLFQLQADLRTSRRILLEETEHMPIAKPSLMREYELSLPDDEFAELCSEPQMANGWVATSTFAAQSLAENGVPFQRIHIVPYGVDADTFIKRPHPPESSKPFRIGYVGSLTAKKGFLYLLEALRRLKSRHSVQLVLFTRGLMDRELLKGYSDVNFEIRIGLSGKRLAAELHACDVFAFPSLAEGFAHVILEAMSCGLPVIATPNTCAPDVLEPGQHGFIVPIRDAEAIAERLEWGIAHRDELAAMGDAAARQARLFTWERFRAGVREAYKNMVASHP